MGRTMAITALCLTVLYGGYQWVVTPHVNPHPEKKVVVRGVYPYDRGWDLQVKTSYISTAPICAVMATAFGIFPAATVSREVWADVPVIRGAGNNYVFTYHEDYFTPGVCGWKQRFVYTHLFQDGQWQHGNDAILGLNGLYNWINYDCHYVELDMTTTQRIKKKRSVVCSQDTDNPHRRDPQLADNEVNFVWNNKIRSVRIVSPGRSESVWLPVEGEGK